MDLYAYSQIEDLEEILKDLNIMVPRLRGIRLMKVSKPVSQEKIEQEVKEVKVDNCVRWLREKAWNCWSSWKDDKKHPSFIYGKIYNEYTEKYETKVIDIDYSKIRRKDRNIIKLKNRKDENRIRKDYELWNKYCGQDVLYVHTRAGGGNRLWCKTDKLKEHPLYLSDCDDSFDRTYCTIYYDIKDVDLTKYIKESDE